MQVPCGAELSCTSFAMIYNAHGPEGNKIVVCLIQQDLRIK
jgi:hypothetical protein